MSCFHRSGDAHHFVIAVTMCYGGLRHIIWSAHREDELSVNNSLPGAGRNCSSVPIPSLEESLKR